MPTDSLNRAIEKTIESATGLTSRIVDSCSVSGGCISSAKIVSLEDDRSFFVKSKHSSSDLFEREAEGLSALSKSNVIKVPEVIGFGETEDGTGFLVLKVIHAGREDDDFFETFGRQLAELHRASSADRFGFETNNYIGSTPQPNSWSENWIEFWTENRIRFQLKLAVDRGIANLEFRQGCENLIAKFGQIVSGSESPSLIHGDLWSGNFMVSSQGSPVLIDPAVYYGAREAEFGMTTLFGGFNSDFYHAYNEVWPMPDGWESRVEVYRLYHLMNHLNLFGPSYLDGCMEILRKYQ